VSFGYITLASCFQQAPAGGGNSANIQQGLRTKLEQIIAANQLQHFFPPQQLQAVLNRLNTVDFRYDHAVPTIPALYTEVLCCPQPHELIRPDSGY